MGEISWVRQLQLLVGVLRTWRRAVAREMHRREMHRQSSGITFAVSGRIEGFMRS
jgi:ribosomal protein S3